MQCTTAPSPREAGRVSVLDLTSLARRLVTLTDTRCPKGVRYPLGPLLLLIVLAKLAGEDRPSGIADWVASREALLREALHLPWPRMPHHTTYRRILAAVIPPAELERLVGEHLGSLPGVGDSGVLAIDGKTVRGTRGTTHPRGEHLLAAYLPMEGVVLGQVRAGDRESEVRAAPRLLAGLDLRGKVVTGDALHTQRALSQQILAAGGAYLWVVKDNQPRLRADIAAVFDDAPTVLGGRVPLERQRSRTVEKGHGRQEERTLTVSSTLQGYSDWPGLAQVFQVARHRVDTRTGQEERETVYGVTSLEAGEADAARLLQCTRLHWGIENGLHGCRDVTFAEDRTRLTQGHAGRVMASLNNLVIGLLRHAGATNLAAARRWWAAQFTHALAPLPAGLLA
jgi:predicted transposase YbfD/YdcC